MTNELQPSATDVAAPTCPQCGAGIFLDQSFCEACGFELSPVATSEPAPSTELESPITLSRSVSTGPTSDGPQPGGPVSPAGVPTVDQPPSWGMAKTAHA